MKRTQAELDHYALKASYGRLTGIGVGCHAISDGYLLMHVGVGCKNKVTHLLAHDWEQHCILRQGWTEVGDRDLISGAAARIGPYLRSWQGRMQPGFVCVAAATVLEMTGEDVAGEVTRAAGGSPVPVTLLDAQGFEGDEYDGYAAVTGAVIRHVDWRREPLQSRQVSILGYWYDRYEGDHSSNLMQLSGLLKGVGGALGPVLLSGRPFEDYLQASESALVVTFPYLSPVEQELKALWERGGRATLAVDLPLGFAGTRRFASQVSAGLGLDGRTAETYLRRREDRARAPLKKMYSRWRRRRVAVFGEPPLAAGLCSLLLELGLRPVLVGLRGASLGGEPEFRAVLDRNGLALSPDAEVLHQPSLITIRQRALALLREGRLDGVLGSAKELNAIRSLSMHEVDPSGRLERGPFLLEVGFPCHDHHALQQMPVMGYGGIVSLAQRLLNPPHLWDHRRTEAV